MATMEILRLRVRGEEDNQVIIESDSWGTAQLTNYSARTFEVGTDEHAEDTSLMTLGRNEKPFTLNYSPTSICKEAYQSPTPTSASLVGREIAV